MAALWEPRGGDGATEPCENDDFSGLSEALITSHRATVKRKFSPLCLTLKGGNNLKDSTSRDI